MWQTVYRQTPINKAPKRRTLHKEKTLKCQHCTRKFKSQDGLEYHMDHFHKGKRSPCPKCGVPLPEKSIQNHMRRHSAQQILDQARRFHLKLASGQRYFAYTSRRLARRDPAPKSTAPTPASKSAPANIKLFKSP